MKSIEELELPYPKGLRKFIWEHTDFRRYPIYSSIRYVFYLQMVDGRPLKRVFAFNGSKKFHEYEDIRIKEVARYYNHKQYLNHCISAVMVGKTVSWDETDHFYLYKNKWTWWASYEMYDPVKFLKKHRFEHTGWEEYYNSQRYQRPDIDLYEYLSIYIDDPRIELLSKAGLGKWVIYLKYLDTSKKSLAEIFRIQPDAVELLKRDDFYFRELMVCRKLKTADMRMIRKELELRDEMARQNRNLCYILQFCPEAKKVMKERKTFTYMRQHSVNPYDYAAYLRDLVKIGALSDNTRRYPDNFHEAHTQLIEQMLEAKKKEEQKRMKSKISGMKRNYEKHKKYSYEDDRYLIKPAMTPDELLTESQELIHCVKSYVDNVAAGTTEIMLIRSLKRPDQPFYTLELKGKRIVQVRGKRNRYPSKDVENFVDEWAKKYKLTWNHQQSAFNHY